MRKYLFFKFNNSKILLKFVSNERKYKLNSYIFKNKFKQIKTLKRKFKIKKLHLYDINFLCQTGRIH